MPPPEKIQYLKQKRREKLFQTLALSLGVASAVIIAVVVIRLIDKRLENDRRTRELVSQERMNSRMPRPADSGAAREGLESPAAGRQTGGVSPEMARREAAREAASAAARARLTDTSNARASLATPDGAIENLDQKKAEISSMLKEFFEARGVSEMLPLVRDARRVRPFMESYYARTPLSPRRWKGIGWAIPVEEPGYRFAYVQALFEGATPPVNVVVEESDRGFFVDWESSVQYSELGWKEFIATRPGQPKMFRVLASKADGDGASETGAALKLKNPREDGVVIGRFDPKDPRFRPLLEQLDLCKWQDVPVILRLCYPGPSASQSEVEIAGVEGKGWLILDDRLGGF